MMLYVTMLYDFNTKLHKTNTYNKKILQHQLQTRNGYSPGSKVIYILADIFVRNFLAAFGS